MSVQYTAIFHGCKNGNFHMKKCEIFLNFAQNIDRWYTLERLAEAVLTSTHDICFKSKNKKKNVYPCKPQFYYIKVGCKEVFIIRTCLHDGECELKKRLNFCKQYKTFNAFWDFIPKCRSWRIVDAVKDKKKEKKKIKIKTTKATKKINK